MVYRVFVEKKPALAMEAGSLLRELRDFFGVKSLTALRILNRYDVEDIDEALFQYACRTVFSEPQLDILSEAPDFSGWTAFAVEYLPGQFDQRADSAAQCIQLLSQKERPTVRTAKVYLLQGDVTPEELLTVQHCVINPVESRLASMEKPKTLTLAAKCPQTVETLTGLTSMPDGEAADYCAKMGLAMDADDLRFFRDYFRSEHHDPTITELRVIDTYWSDHCRHTTFLTTIDRVTFGDPLLQAAYERYLAARGTLGRTKPVNLMDIATIAAKVLKSEGRLDKLDESEEINACTVKITVETESGPEPWLLLFKNETHNHPTEIEPFGGAATCIGGAIRDPLSGRAYVYGAMRVTGAADPLQPPDKTLPGKLPQRKLVTTAAAGYSSYGNQIGLATGVVDELYHDGYAAKRLEIGAVIAAVPARNVRREEPQPGDAVILLGGRTGRDGCGGATGSSKSHTLESLETCGAEVQKGNAPEERKLQRLFRNPDAARMIKRCNDFGAGGVCVAIGELAAGLDVDLNKVPRKYDGLDGTELAISESQERMAVVVAQEDADAFRLLAARENLESALVAHVTEEPRLRLRWNGRAIVDLSRAFVDSNGAEKHIAIEAEAPKPFAKPVPADFRSGMLALASGLNVCSRRGLSERFDSTIGAGTILMPFGGKYQRTPIQAMAQKISLERGHTDDCSFMAWGCNPHIAEDSPYHGGYLAVVEAVSKLIASGASFEDVYLSLQEYFEKPGQDPKRWGQPLSALLGAFSAQLDLGVAAIGGKDSMSGSFESLDVPPTLCAFAVTTGKAKDAVGCELKAAGHRLCWLKPECDENGLPKAASLIALYQKVTALLKSGAAVSAWTPGFGGAAEGLLKTALGNGVGVKLGEAVSLADLFSYAYGSFILEAVRPIKGAQLLGETTADPAFCFGGERVALDELLHDYEAKLEPVYPAYVKQDTPVEAFSFAAKTRVAPPTSCAKPRVVIPVFPGTNCEYDSARAFRDAGAEPQILVVNNLSAAGVSRSVEELAAAIHGSQIIFLPGGFSGGDEPDGSGKFITSFFRNPAIREAVGELLDKRGGLMAGICNGFQALIKLGLVPYGKIVDTDENSPTLTYNLIGRHQSRIVRTRIASNLSPWLAETRVGEIYSVPISHGEGRFLASEPLIRQLAAKGQIATQYVDMDGNVTSDVLYNPNGSAFGVEGITSPDGRVFGKMGHAERKGSGLYANVPGNYDIGMFRSAVKYFK
jgi:phosphoribosylformylglycinamidine synthase